MLEGLPPNNAAHMMTFTCLEREARIVAELIVEMFDPADVAASAFEREPNTKDWSSSEWIVEAYFGSAPDEDYVRSLVSEIAGEEAARTVVFSRVAEKDWIAAGLEGLPPVRAGRFLVHGSHDRGTARSNDISLEIEAALAFGTGHHGTTRGCLLMLDWVLKRRRPFSILDVGTGTGVLAIAAAKALRQTVIAGDIDPVSVEAARSNAILNGVAPWVRPVTAPGLEHMRMRHGGPYDLIFANILARPLRALAPSIARVGSLDGDVILSGLLAGDVPGVLTAYAAQGYRLSKRIDIEGWATLLLRVGGATSEAVMFEAVFQSFTESADPSHGAARAAALRDEMKARGLHGFIVPRADEHQNEYVPANAERLAWLTGFSGSAGLAIVLADRAAIFVDGRYTLQVRDQVDVAVFTPLDSGATTPESWLADNLRTGERLAYDPWLTTPGTVERYAAAARKAGAELVALESNPLDAVWSDRPAPPLEPVRLYPKRLAGVDATKKLADVAKALDGVDALVVSNPHNSAWAFNIRGADVSHTPLPLCFAIIPAQGRPRLYVDGRKIADDVRAALEAICDLDEPSRLIPELEAMGRESARVRFDASSAPMKLVETLRASGGKADLGADPITLMKARKNAAEIRGSRAAHVRDGAAMCEFLAWFSENAPAGKLTEIDAVKALESFRRDTRKLKEVSFPTISGAGPNGAIVHYRVTERTNRKIGKGLFLLDSGAQYEDGTTDITRTLSAGKPNAEMRDRYTRVLKGHIAIATAVFPKGTSGAQIDAFARRALWDAGLDYDHGTGHGVGAFLSVHEGPQNISKRASCALEPGMILSNEPGYYKTGAYGVRLENLVLVETRDVKGGEREVYGFETLTLAPFDLACIELRLLTHDELRCLDGYHARVRRELSPLLTTAARKWLAQATKAMARQ